MTCLVSFLTHICCYTCVFVLAQGKERDSWEPPEWVPRVRLHFEAEDPFVFARRFADAHERRARSESLLRYSLYVDSMPMEDLPALTTEAVSGAVGRRVVVVVGKCRGLNERDVA